MPIIAGKWTGGKKVEKNSQNFSMEDARMLANSPLGQQLFGLLQAKNPEAVSQAASGNYETLQQSLASLLADPEIRALLRQLGG